MISGIAEIRGAYQDGEVARQYVQDRFATPLGALLHARQTKALRQAMAAERPVDVLEIAPGPARLTAEIVDLAPRLTLIDSSAQMLHEAKRRLTCGASVRHTFVHGDAFRLPFRSRFDLVYSFRLIRHFAAEERQRLYCEIRRVLRPGGLLVLDAINQRVYERARAGALSLEHYDASFDPRGLRAELTAAGLHVESLVGAQHAYRVLYGLQVLVAPRSPKLARLAMNVVDCVGAGEPLEWVVTCRRA